MSIPKEAEPKQLTLVVSGADLYEASCPELRIAYYSEDIDAAREGLYTALNQKATSIAKRNGDFPLSDLAPYAKLFVKNRKKVRDAILEGKEILAAEA